MKILVVHTRYFITAGPERYLFNLKEALVENGHEVIPFSVKNDYNQPTPYGDYFAENIGKGNEVYIEQYEKKLNVYRDLMAREFYSFHVKKKLKKLIKDSQPDICYLLVYKRTLSPSVIDACVEMNLPIVNRLSDYNLLCANGFFFREGKICDRCQRASSWNAILHKCVKQNRFFSIARTLSEKLQAWLKMDKKIAAYVCTNQFMREKLIEAGFDEKKLHLIPTFFRENKMLQELDKQNKIEKTIRFIYAGNINEEKGIYDLLDAFREVKNTHANFFLQIVGGTNPIINQEVKDIIERYNLTAYIDFKPFDKSGKIFDKMLVSNVTIIPCRWFENLPNVLIESIYFGRPVMVPELGSFKYTANDDVAFKYKALSVTSLADAIRDVLDNPHLIKVKSEQCPAFYEENFSQARHLEKLFYLFAKKTEKNIVNL